MVLQVSLRANAQPQAAGVLGPLWAGLSLLTFLAALFAAAWALRALTPDVPLPEIDRKLAAYRARSGEINALFFGTSRINHGLLPELFDETVRKGGGGTRSFDAGVDGMAFPEMEYYYERFMKENHGALRWVFMELTPIRTEIPAFYRGTDRMPPFHDVRRTLEIVRAVIAKRARPGPPGPAAHLTLVWEHLGLAGQRAINLGRGARWRDRLNPAPPQAEPPVGDGYVPMRRHLSPEERADWQRQLDAFPQGSPKPLDPISEQLIRQMTAKIRAAGATPIFLVAPNVTPTLRLPARAGAKNPEVWDFEQPARYPQLYVPEARADIGHLGDEGAHAWTQLLAAEFCRRFVPPATRREPPP